MSFSSTLYLTIWQGPSLGPELASSARHWSVKSRACLSALGLQKDPCFCVDLAIQLRCSVSHLSSLMVLLRKFSYSSHLKRATLWIQSHWRLECQHTNCLSTYSNEKTNILYKLISTI